MKRDFVYQFVLIIVIVIVAFIIFSATQTNLEKLGVESSIDFMWKRAGFEIGQTLIDYNANSSIARAFVVALLNTLVLTASCIFCASILGLVLGVSRLSSNWLVSHLAMAYVEIFRNIPALLQIFFWYFVVLRSMPRISDSLVFFDSFFLNNRGFFFPAPETGSGGLYLVLSLCIALALSCFLLARTRKQQARSGRRFLIWLVCLILIPALPMITQFVLGISWEIPTIGRFSYEGGFMLMPEFIALLVGLSMYNATYISEIVRSSICSIPGGQTEAADSLGIPRHLSLRFVILPQAIRIMIPPLVTVYLGLFKSTSLAAAIAYPEIISVFVGTVNNLVGQPVIIMAITLTVYLLISLCISIFLNWYNRRVALTRGHPL